MATPARLSVIAYALAPTAPFLLRTRGCKPFTFQRIDVSQKGNNLAETAESAIPYSPEWFGKQSKGSLASARRVVPLVLNAVCPTSVVDVGCGIGAWLSVFREHGVQRTIGLDGDYVERRNLRIDATDFVPTDLRRPFAVAGRFDLAICLEVAEHLPAANASVLVDALVGAAPCVLFSAAIPGQGGTNHINEQWQDYWRALFAAANYQPVDWIRPQVWGLPDVEPWYQQNAILFCAPEKLASDPKLVPLGRDLSLNVVHPAFYLNARQENVPYLSKSLKSLPGLVREAVLRRFGRPSAG